MKSIKLLLGTLITLLLVTSAKGQAGDYFYSTLDPNSTPGDFYGKLYLSFTDQSTGSYVYFGFSTPATYTLSGAQLTLDLYSSWYEEPGEFAIVDEPQLTDSRMNNASTWWKVNFDPGGYGYILPGQPGGADFRYDSGNMALVDYSEGPNPWAYAGTIDISFDLPVYYDGANGNGVGSWSVTYTVPSPVPEPAVGWLIALGGFGLIPAFCSKRRQQKQG